MGLDISVYSKLEYIETLDYDAYEEKYGWDNEEVTIARHWNSDYPERADPIIENGVYRVFGDTFGFRAGSYSGYNRWREWLAMQAHGVTPEVIWNAPLLYERTPFYEIIHFADNEGIIGSVVAAKLKSDFDTFTPSGHDGYELASYMNWIKAFRMAADNGMVIFH